MKLLAEIRGMHFRLSDPVNPSPAKLLVAELPGGTRLRLVRDAGNEYDPNAIQVWIEPAALGEEALSAGSEFESKLAGYGWSLEQVRDAPELMLGFIGKEWAEVLAPEMDRGSEPEAAFAVSGKGKPLANIEIGEEEKEEE